MEDRCYRQLYRDDQRFIVSVARFGSIEAILCLMASGMELIGVPSPRVTLPWREIEAREVPFNLMHTAFGEVLRYEISLCEDQGSVLDLRFTVTFFAERTTVEIALFTSRLA